MFINTPAKLNEAQPAVQLRNNLQERKFFAAALGEARL
jgi:hypothetical protein